MSIERNYQCYLADIHTPNGIHTAKADDVIRAAAINLRTDPRTGAHLPGGDSESDIRRKLSVLVGGIEESKFGTRVDEETKKRYKVVPERHTAHHNRLVDDLYAKVVPVEDAAD